MATGFKVKNKCQVLISIGSLKDKEELFQSIQTLANNGFTISGTPGTAKYYSDLNVPVTAVENDEIYRKIKEGFYGLVINISIPNKIRTLEKTNGYYIRRLSIDYGVAVIINIKCAKLYVDSLVSCYDESLLVGESDYQQTELSLPYIVPDPKLVDNSSDEESLGDLEEIRKNNNNYKNKLLKRDSTHPELLNIKHVLNVSQFTRGNLRSLFKNATILKQNVKRYGKLDILKGKIVGLYFDEPSSRTYGSFYGAVKKLGGDVLPLNASNSSAKKGETLYDTLKCIEAYADLVVIRTKSSESLEEIQNRIKIPIINAGNGDGEHPTQALLDIYTMREERGTVNKLVVSLVGDLKYGRTVHSLVRLLSNYKITFNFVSVPELRLDDGTRQFLEERNIAYREYDSISQVIETTDVIYMTRIQKERFEDKNESEKLDLEYIEKNLYLNPEILTNAKDNMVIMHPLPRNAEIDVNIDLDPRAAYFRQMENGLYVRMALIQLLI